MVGFNTQRIDRKAETWPNALTKSLKSDRRCGDFFRKYLKKDPDLLHPIFMKFGSSTFSKALELSDVELQALITECTAKTPDEIQAHCEEKLLMRDCVICADATYVSCYSVNVLNMFTI